MFFFALTMYLRPFEELADHFQYSCMTIHCFIHIVNFGDAVLPHPGPSKNRDKIVLSGKGCHHFKPSGNHKCKKGSLIIQEVPIMINDVSIMFHEVPMMFNGVSIMFQEVSVTFQEVPMMFSEVSIMFQNVPMLFHEVPIIFHKVLRMLHEVSVIFRKVYRMSSLVTVLFH